jgi:type VI protein secretion system component Hcp
MIRPVVIGSIFAVAASLVAPQALSGVYMKTDPERKGDVVEQNHKDWINLIGLTGGFARQACDDLGVVKTTDKATTQLIADAVQGSQFTKITIHVTKPDPGGKGEQPYIIFTLTPSDNATRDRGFVSVSGLSASVDPDFGLVEEVSLALGKVELEYKVLDPATGKAIGSTKSNFDCVTQ